MIYRLLCALVLFIATPVWSAERITQFDAQIVLESNGNLIVTETIKVEAENIQIKRGIFRDLPRTTRDGDGDIQPVSYDIVQVLRDGKEEPFFTKNDGGNKRIYIGDKNVFLPRGPYTYTIKYRTANQTRHFDNHAEIFWNVTGNDWIFPIDKASATVFLPTGGAIKDTTVFTGVRGSRDSNAVIEVIEDNAAKFETTTPLKRKEGLTVAVKFDSGIIPRPEKIRYYSGIDNFQSDMTLDTSGELSVVERFSLTVTESDPIIYGLIREFERPQGINVSIAPKISDIEATRNGQAIDSRFYDFRYEDSIYLDKYNSSIPAGKHTIELRYRVSRQVNFGAERDTFTWYGLPKGFRDMQIAQASARITVPGAAAGVKPDFSMGKDATADPSGVNVTADGSSIIYSVLPPANDYGQLALSLSLPKGMIAEPTFQQRLAYFWQDYSYLLIGYIAMAFVGLYYLLTWMYVGHDPETGTIVPDWHPPEGVSPALVSYIEHEGLRNSGRNAMSSALINLGVRGLITMHGFDDTLTVKRTDEKTPKDLPVGEAALLKKINKKGMSFSRSNSVKVRGMTTAFSQAMTNEHRKSYFRKNWPWFILGVFLSLIAVAFYAFHDSNFSDEIIENSFPLLVLSIVLSVFINIGLKIVRNLISPDILASRVQSIVTIAMLGFFLFNLGGMIMHGPIKGLLSLDIKIALPVVGIIGLNVLFWFLIGAPTKLGQEVMNKIDGLRLYLKMAEADRMNMAGAPAMTPQHFETLLPYAVALKLEKPWAAAFDRWLNQPVPSDVGPRVYTSSWNRDWASGGFDSSLNLGSSVASGFASAIPKSSSSGSGFSGSSSSGFSSSSSSGGGGGGGGGGGW